MQFKAYERKTKESLPVLAICYDFDRTLTPEEMQSQGIIQDLGLDATQFWSESNAFAEQNDMDQNLAYMYKISDLAEGKIIPNKQAFLDYGAKVQLFPGVEQWFERIKEYGKRKGVIIEHYIISSGIKEMIEGTSIAKAGCFEKIYANSYYFSERGTIKWPAQVINYTNKTQFLFRIQKGVLNINDFGVNDYFSPEDIRVPFRNIVYIGDSDSDIPCMKVVTSNGGHSIGVYDPETKDKTKVYKMMRENRIKYFAPSDYREDTELDKLVKAIIDRTAANEILEEIHIQNAKEKLVSENNIDKIKRRKQELIKSLEESRNFARTHEIIDKMSGIYSWSKDEKEEIYKIALKNSQVLSILTDYDIKQFFEKLLKASKNLSIYGQSIRKNINK